MRLLFYIRHSSIRTKFLLFTLSIFVIINIFISLYYPYLAYQSEQDNIITNFDMVAEVIEKDMDINITDDNEYINTMFYRLELFPLIEFTATRYRNKEYRNPADKYTYAQIDSLAENTVHEINGKHILVISHIMDDIMRIGSIDLKVGLDASKIINAEEDARFYSFISIIFSAVLIYLIAFFFDKIIYVPLKKIINISRLVSIGQRTIEKGSGLSHEYNQVIGFLEIIAQRMNELIQDNKMFPLTVRKSQERAAEIQKNLDQELETLSNLVVYILELRKEKSKEGIYKNLVKEITGKLKFSICIFFKFENHKLVFSQSSFPGFTVLDDKIKMDLKNYIITDQNPILKEMQKHNPLIQKELPFNEVMAKYNILGNYALVPLSTAKHFYGMIVFGNLGEKSSIKHKDLEKLMLLSNTVALHLENIENFSNLERNVAQRTDELKTTIKLLSESIVEKDTMLKLVSHDLNAPLRNVLGLVESIERKYKTEIDTDMLDRLERIRKNVEKELSMIDEILTSFKSTENFDMQQEVDTNELIKSILDELNYELKLKNVKVIMDKNLPVINSNQTILKHIFLNLIDNACKYMPAKNRGNKIQISYNKNKEYSTFMVIDNGIGIAPEDQSFVFDAFKRVATSEAGGSKGLGLTLVENMVGKLGGDISFNSVEDKGTTFYIRFRNQITNQVN